MEKLQILMVEPDYHDRAVYERDLRLADYWDIDLLEVESGAEAQLVLESPNHIDCILLGLKLPDGSGLEYLHKWQQEYDNLPSVVILTRFGDERVAVDAIKSGAADYLSKKALLPGELARVVRQASHLTRLSRELKQQRAMRRQAELELREAQENSGELAGVQKTVATFMHELNSPIAGITAYLQMLLEESVDEDLRGIYLEMLDACKRIGGVLHSMEELRELHALHADHRKGPINLAWRAADAA
jgi:DNA-binding NtrC family response regulator